MLRRRDLLRAGIGGAGLLFVSKAFPSALAANSPDSSIEILLDEQLGIISPDIYGHFAENLSGVIYDGIWVGEKSPVPNLDGIRKELIDEMRKINAPVVRFPGGCFADSYDWRDGVGPRDKRPRRTNFWAEGEAAAAPASHRYDPNQFGTNEFCRFCELTGAKPYLAADVRSLPAEEFYRWIEYCNSLQGSTTLADMRAADGHPQPFNVQFWGVGNEAWGCGGNFTAQEYAVEFRRFVTWVPRYGRPVSFIGSGPDGNNSEWTRGFFEELIRKGRRELRSLYGWSLHYYSWNLSRGKTQDWNEGKGNAVKFDVTDWYELLREGNRLDSIIGEQWNVMGELDTDHSVKLVIDEWGPWYKPGSELTPGDQLEQLPTLRDAVFSGMTLDIFNRHPEKIIMANCAQLINCLNSLYLAHEDKFCITPVGHLFGMYAAHQGGKAVRAVFSCPDVHYDRDGKPASFWGLNGSASLHEKQIVLTVVNPHASEARESQVRVRGAKIQSAKATVLSGTDLHAHNDFSHRDALTPRAQDVRVADWQLIFTFAPASVTKLALTLA